MPYWIFLQRIQRYKQLKTLSPETVFTVVRTFFRHAITVIHYTQINKQKTLNYFSRPGQYYLLLFVLTCENNLFSYLTNLSSNQVTKRAYSFMSEGGDW